MGRCSTRCGRSDSSRRTSASGTAAWAPPWRPAATGQPFSVSSSSEERRRAGCHSRWCGFSPSSRLEEKRVEQPEM